MRVVSEDIRPDTIHAHGEKALFCTTEHELNIPVVVTAHHGGFIQKLLYAGTVNRTIYWTLKPFIQIALKRSY